MNTNTKFVSHLRTNILKLGVDHRNEVNSSIWIWSGAGQNDKKCVKNPIDTGVSERNRSYDPTVDIRKDLEIMKLALSNGTEYYDSVKKYLIRETE